MSHSITVELEDRSRLWRIANVWFAVFGGIGAWAVHIIFEASFVRYRCNAGSGSGVMHLVTAVTAIATVVAMALSWRLMHLGDDESADSQIGRARFLGITGLLIGGINLMLILLEGSYVLFWRACG
jgi:hypothetical protein